MCNVCDEKADRVTKRLVPLLEQELRKEGLANAEVIVCVMAAKHRSQDAHDKAKAAVHN